MKRTKENFVRGIVQNYEDALSRAFGVIHNHTRKNIKIYEYSLDNKGMLKYVIYNMTYMSDKYLYKLAMNNRGELVHEMIQKPYK